MQISTRKCLIIFDNLFISSLSKGSGSFFMAAASTSFICYVCVSDHLFVLLSFTGV